MKLSDIARRAFRSLKNAKARTILTSLAIAVGAFTLTLSLAAGEGARQYADKLITSNIDPQSLIIAKDKNLFSGGAAAGGLKEYSPNQTQYGGATFKALSQADIDKVAQIKGIESVRPTYLVSATYVQFQGKKQKYTTDITAYDSSIRAEVAAGSLPALGDSIGKRDIVVPESFADTLHISPKKLIGRMVTLHLEKAAKQPSQAELEQTLATKGIQGLAALTHGESKDVTFTVSAVSAKSSTSLSASNGLFISDNAAKELSDYLTKGTDQYQRYITATVMAKKGVDPEMVKQRIEKHDIMARTAKDLQGLLFTIVNTLQGIVAGFGVIALIASVFGIINTQYISVLERTREIGLMKALGMRGKHVSRLFQLEAAWIGFLGGVIGACLAWVVGTALNPWISDTLSLGDSRILIFQLLPVVILIIVLMLIAMLAGWFPARKAAKLDPIDALRTE